MDDWASLAAGLTDQRRRDELLEHAAGCDACGAVLRAVVEDFSEDTTAAESEAIQSLRSAGPEWQRAMARRMSEAAQPHRVPVRTWLAKAAAVLVAVGTGWLGWSYWLESDPARLIAAAYAEERPFDFRIPGAAHAPKSDTRGGSSPFHRSQALLDAEATIKRKLAQHPDSVEWLSLRARAEMLERSAEDPIQTLQHALEQKPDNPDLLADLGMAYALRGEQAESRDVDYGYAIEYLSRALKAKPNAPETAFNRAIVYERMYLIDSAIGEWRHYLDLDGSGAWREEAHRRLADVEQIKKARQAAVARISNDPEAFLRRVAAGDELEAERYQDVAIREWLPRRWQNASYERALAALATRLQEHHGDLWLRDVLAARRSDALVNGLAALAEAVRLSGADESEGALPKSQEARSLLQSAGGRAAALRAELQEAFALHRNRQLKECLEKAMTVERAAGTAGYSWILGQAILEHGVCRGGAGDPGEQQAEMTRALALVRKAGYNELQMRAESMLAGAETTAGNLMAMWKVGRRELATYWNGPYPETHGLEIYYNLMRSAKDLDLPETAYVLERAAAAAIGETQLHLGRAVHAAIAARMAVMAGKPGEAQAQFRESAALFDGLQRTQVNQEFRTYAELYRAEAEASAGAPRAAVERLEAIRSSAENVRAALLRIEYYKALGDSEWRSGRPGEAEAAYRHAIDWNEHALENLRGARGRAQQMLAAADAYRGLVQVLWDRGDTLGALRLWEWFRAGDQPGPRIGQDLDERRSRLRSETFLTYVVLPGGPVAWLFNDREMESRHLNVKPAVLEAVASRFLRECADPASDRRAIRRDGRLLYDWLVAPFAGRLDASRTLVIEPDGPVGAIAMQALMDENSRFLGERLVIAVASGLADYQRREAAGGVNARLQALVVSDPNLGEEISKAFPPLEGAMREGEAIAERFPGARLLPGEEATLRAVEEYGPQAELLHFAGHGFSNAGNGGLLLSPERAEPNRAGILDGARLAQKDWSRCRLAVLSACSTGTGEARGPVNPESLVRGLLWAGVARVVASRWNMDSETGAALIDRFYDRLLSGDDVAKALQQAARNLRENTATSHPYYWAGFQNFGAR